MPFCCVLPKALNASCIFCAVATDSLYLSTKLLRCPSSIVGRSSLGVGTLPYFSLNFLCSTPGAAPNARIEYKGCFCAIMVSLTSIPSSLTICSLILLIAKDFISRPLNALRLFAGSIDSMSFITPSIAADLIIIDISSKKPFNPTLSTITCFNSSLVLLSKTIPSPLADVIVLASFKMSLVGNAPNLFSIAVLLASAKSLNSP